MINESIILVALFKQLRDSGVAAMEAAIEAGRRRLRAVVLTSLTTVAGIMPLLFETAREAEFLKPMVISIGFGLIFGTFMVLFLLPSVLVSIEVMLVRANRVRSGFADWLAARKPMEALTLDRIRPSTRPDPTTADSKEMAK